MANSFSSHHIWGAIAVAASIAAPLQAGSAAPVAGQGTWQSTLHARDLDGNPQTAEGWYDSTLDVTWLAEADFGSGSPFDSADGTADGRITWQNAMDWAASLVVGGFDGWRLPSVLPVNGYDSEGTPLWDFTFHNNGTSDRGAGGPRGWIDNGWIDGMTPTNELGHMFFVTLANLSACAANDEAPTGCSGRQDGAGLSNTGPFAGLTDGIYWSSVAPQGEHTAFRFGLHFGDGWHDTYHRASSQGAWAVHDGDIGAAVVPVPSGFVLFVSALLGLQFLPKRSS